MSKERANEVHISERQLAAMTRDLDELHHETLPSVDEAIEGFASTQPDVLPPRRGIGRRSFLLGAGAAAGGLALAACGTSKSSKGHATSTSTGQQAAAGHGGSVATDLAVAGLAASLENLAVQTYQTAASAASAGKLGAVPPAIVTFVQTASKQHADHAGAWNSIRQRAGKAPVTAIDQTVYRGVVQPGLAKVKTIPDVAKLALELENAAAATYLNAIQNALSQASAVQIAATIQPVEMQHSAILNLVLGDYPVPDSFATTTGARPLSDKIG